MGKGKQISFDGNKMKNIPTSAMIEAGNKMANELWDANMDRMSPSYSFQKIIKYSANKDILTMYLSEKIDSVTAIYMAMERTKEAK